MLGSSAQGSPGTEVSHGPAADGCGPSRLMQVRAEATSVEGEVTEAAAALLRLTVTRGSPPRSTHTQSSHVQGLLASGGRAGPGQAPLPVPLPLRGPAWQLSPLTQGPSPGYGSRGAYPGPPQGGSNFYPLTWRSPQVAQLYFCQILSE